MMTQGDRYYIPVDVIVDDENITPSMIDEMKIRFGNLLHTYPNGSLLFENNEWKVPVAQQWSMNLRNKVKMQARVKFKNGAITSSDIENVDVEKTLIKEVW